MSLIECDAGTRFRSCSLRQVALLIQTGGQRIPPIGEREAERALEAIGRENAVGGPPCGSGIVRRGDRRDPGLATGTHDRRREAMPRGVARRREVIQARALREFVLAARDKALGGLREGTRPIGRASLIGDDAQFVALGGETLHRLRGSSCHAARRTPSSCAGRAHVRRTRRWPPRPQACSRRRH